MTLEQLKETQKQIGNVFGLLYNADFKGSQGEAVWQALKFIDSLFVKVKADIDALEPKPEAKEKAVEPTTAVQEAVQPAEAV